MPNAPIPNASILRSLSLAAALAGTATPAAASEEHHVWKERPHHLSFLAGVSDNDEGSATTFGVDYEYRYSEFLGLGAIAEQAFEEIDATTFLAVADLHITNQFIVQTGPGVELLHEDDEEEFVFRLGVLYEWELGDYTVSPQFHCDWTEEDHTLIFGFAFGRSF